MDMEEEKSSLMTFDEVAAKLGVSRGTIHRWRNNKLFPDPIKMNSMSRKVFWKRETIEKYLEGKEIN
jgi:predicted DNA-binding transcriptional regulator AlpA